MFGWLEVYGDGLKGFLLARLEAANDKHPTPSPQNSLPIQYTPSPLLVCFVIHVHASCSHPKNYSSGSLIRYHFGQQRVVAGNVPAGMFIRLHQRIALQQAVGNGAALGMQEIQTVQFR